MLKHLLSKKGQLSMEFGLLMLAVVVGATIVGYYLISSALYIKTSQVNNINETSDITLKALHKVD